MDATTTKRNEKKEEVFKINVPKTATFVPTKETLVTTSIEFAKIVNSIFKPIYQDYYGCNIIPVVNGAGYGFTVHLGFTIPDNGYDDEKPSAFIPVEMAKSGSMVDRVQRVINTSMTPKSRFEMTKYGKEGLLPFLGLGCDRNGQRRNPSWENRMKVTQDNRYGGNGKVCITLEGFDPIEIVKAFYGDKDKDKGMIWYQVSAIRPLGDPIASSGNIQNWTINIDRLCEKPLEDATRSIGIINPYNGPVVPMIRA